MATCIGRLTVAAALALLAGVANAAPEVTLKLHHFLSPKAPAHAAMLAPWAERVEKASNGRIKIDIYPSMTLGGKPPQLIRQVRDGVVDIIWAVNGYAAGSHPRTEVFELPFVHTNNAVATNMAMYDTFDEYLADDYKDVKVLALHVHAGQAIHMVDSPVRTASDLEGKKMRIPTRTGAWILEALGATPVGMPVPELPQALSKKVVDGALIPFEIIRPLKIHELTKYQIEGVDNTRFGTTTFQISMNPDSWNRLPDDLKKVMDEQTGAAWWREIGEIWTRTETGGLKAAVDAGNEHILIGKSELAKFEKRLQPVVDRWIAEVEAKGIDGRALVAAARAAIARHSK
ncbi:MAG: TRAP transporter substrate-binding protein [Gammaproteobacteria bacterium]|nr:TRAP transporter substrate-binding protein [Gammaproteobacteria bacterium]